VKAILELQIHSFLPVSEGSINSRLLQFSQSVDFAWQIYNLRK
jgi:hypothetical protein